MNEKINQYLTKIEVEKNIKILFACETGSRAWGFPSPDSDYDVRMIYVHQKDWYLSINERTDSVERMFENNDIDISGWELRKSLRLLQKSNASLLERIQSPIIYRTDDAFVSDFFAASQVQYSRIATIHHYLSMAKNFIEVLESTKDYKLKNFFYALRSAAVCKWILMYQGMPPIEFAKIYPNIGLPNDLVNRIEELIQLKNTISEAYLHTGEADLINFMRNCIRESKEKKHSLPSAIGNTEALNILLRKFVK